MILEINDKTTISHIQKQFRKAYPFLKIRFADQPHQFGEETKNCRWHPSHVRVSEITDSFEAASVIIHPYNKVGDIEQLFNQKFKLYPQIFRRDEYQWIQTAGTDIVPIDEQNEMGKNSMEKLSGLNGIESTHLL